MERNERSLGRCPNCGADVPPALKLIEYERDDGSVGMYADCPSCDEVVAPE